MASSLTSTCLIPYGTDTNTMETSTGAVPVMARTGIEGKADHLRELQETESNTAKCAPNYRNRLNHVIKFWKENYPGYYDEVVFDLSEEQKRDKHRYWTATQDLRYELLNPKLMKLFMSGIAKTKQGGRHYSFEHACKYHDAVLCCAKLAKKNLSTSYINEMRAFIKTFKKEKATARSQDKCDEKDAEPFVAGRSRQGTSCFGHSLLSSGTSWADQSMWTHWDFTTSAEMVAATASA